jgi:hypothetical protein
MFVRVAFVLAVFLLGLFLLLDWLRAIAAGTHL